MKLELAILKNLVYNEDFLRKVLPFIKSDYFSDRTERTIFDEITSFTETYNNAPSIEALSIAIKEKNIVVERQRHAQAIEAGAEVSGGGGNENSEHRQLTMTNDKRQTANDH